MSMLIFTLLAALVLHPAESDSVDDNDAAAADAAADAAAADAAAADAAANAAAADAAAEDEDEDTKVLLNEYAHVLLLGENDDKLTNVKIIKDNAAGVKVETSGNEYIHKTFKGMVQNVLIDIRTFLLFARLSVCWRLLVLFLLV